MSASFDRAEVLEALGATARGQLPAAFPAVTTDTRSVAPGALFFALKGETFDGHDFLARAAEAGAGAAVVRRGAALPAGLPGVEVDDTLVALGLLARWHRRRFSIPVGAITGSNGKTTTKEMIGAILARSGPALKTEGNLNNEVGVPLTLFRLSSEHERAIVEMGMNHPGEIARLVSYAEPSAALVTSVAAAHLEGLGTIEAVARAKGEIFQGLKAGALAIANADDALVLEQARLSGRPMMTFGRGEGCDVRLESVVSHDASGLRVRIGYRGRSHEARLAFVGEHNALNACAAFAMGVALGCDPERCVEGLELARPWAHRLSLVQAPGGFTVIDDCYNANPGSMAAALQTLAALAGARRKVAVLGDMLELGASEEGAHRRLGEQALEAGVDVLVAFGPRSQATRAAASRLGPSALHVASTESVAPAAEFLSSRLRPGDVVLVKGSRGMRLERLVQALTGQAGEGH